MTRLLVTDKAFADKGKLDNFTLDLAYGEDENDFELVVPPDRVLETNTLAYVPETEWGGLIREESSTRDEGVSWRTYKGPTWHGLLDQRILRPPSGQTHLALAGDVHSIIAQVIAICGLGDIFAAPSEDYGVSLTYTFDRYCTAFEGLRKMLRGLGLRLSCRRGGTGKTMVSAVPGKVLIDDNRGSKFGYKVSFLHPVNHYVCIGEGEMGDRVVVDLYADSEGNISGTQTIFGLDEIQYRYEYTSADVDRLIESGVESLAGKQIFTEADLTIPEGGDYMLDDIVGVADFKMGREFLATITKIIVKAQSKGKAKTSFEFSDVVSTRLEQETQ